MVLMVHAPCPVHINTINRRDLHHVIAQWSRRTVSVKTTHHLYTVPGTKYDRELNIIEYFFVILNSVGLFIFGFFDLSDQSTSEYLRNNHFILYVTPSTNLNGNIRSTT